MATKNKLALTTSCATPVLIVPWLTASSCNAAAPWLACVKPSCSPSHPSFGCHGKHFAAAGVLCTAQYDLQPLPLQGCWQECRCGARLLFLPMPRMLRSQREILCLPPRCCILAFDSVGEGSARLQCFSAALDAQLLLAPAVCEESSFSSPVHRHSSGIKQERQETITYQWKAVCPPSFLQSSTWEKILFLQTHGACNLCYLPRGAGFTLKAFR